MSFTRFRRQCRTSLAALVISALGAVGIPTDAAAQTSPASPPDGRIAGWLKIRAEHRSRFEGFTAAGFTGNRDDFYWLNRFRVTATLTPSRWLSGVVQGQDARVYGKNTGSQGPPFRDTIDLRMAYAEIAPHRSLSLRAGRQELAFGEQRLVGHVSWSNTARTFDGVRATYRGNGYQVDGFATSVVTIRSGDFNKSGYGNAFLGLHGSASRLPGHVLEPYVFWRAARGVTTEALLASDLAQATVGIRWAGRLPASFDGCVEMAVQRGSVGTDDISAWAGHWQVARSVRTAPASPRFIGEYNYATGDADPADGVRAGFDHLYPTPHDKYGLADQVGWRNIHHARAGVEIKPRARWTASGSYHSWWLARPRDGLYTAGGALLARSADGSAGVHVGQELDGQLVYSYSPQLQIAAGYAHIFPGEFLDRTTPGHAYRFPYLMVTYVFVGR
jgi:hypothetical protein